MVSQRRRFNCLQACRTRDLADDERTDVLKRSAMAAISLLSFLVLAAGSLPANAAIRASSHPQVRSSAALEGYNEPLCQSDRALCADTAYKLGGEYVGHDEPSLLF